MKTNLFSFGILTAFLVLGFDQISKAQVLALFRGSDAPVKLTEFFNLALVWNRGISFGLFSGTQAWMPYLLMGFAAILTFAVGFWLSKAEDRLQALACGLIIGGAIGNVIDRIRFGAVVDFLDFHIQNWHYPAFNIADSAICIGAFLLLYDSVFRTKFSDDEKTDSAS